MINTNSPLVSVIITCYNYADYVEAAIKSVLNQTYKNKELIIINDGSTDGSLDIINGYKDRARVISRGNKGIVYTRNEALGLASGEYVCFLDADDYFNQDYIENMVATAVKYRADVVYPNWRVFGDDEYKKEFPEFDLQKLIRQEIHCTSESLIRKDAIGNHKFESEKIAEDWDFFLGLALAGRKFKLAKDCFINYRVRKGSRATTNPYWDDMYHFYEILQKWSRKYPKVVNPVDLPIHAGRIRDDHIESQSEIIKEKDEAIQHLRVTLENQEKVNQEIQKELHAIQQSRSYRTGKFLAKPIAYAREVNSGLRRQYRKLPLENNEDREYKKALSSANLPVVKSKARRLAVVIHLFYTDNWPLFEKKLLSMPADSYDLFITIPAQNRSISEEIRKTHPRAYVIVVPNRGRDVLPFIKVAQRLSESGYESVLKFHSKKSTHRTDGQDWLESMLEDLLPGEEGVLQSIRRTLDKKDTGIIGPSGVYYPLTVNFPANGPHMTRVITDIYGKDAERQYLQSQRADYGFFGGTMFWARLDAIKPLLGFSARRFESESGQIDATFAHALERLFCIVPEIEGRKMFEVSAEGVHERPYKSDNIPNWSEDHDK